MFAFSRGVSLTHLGMVKAGVGPRNFTTREVHDFMCIAALREGGYFDLRVENDEALDEFYLGYPNIEAIHVRLITYFGSLDEAAGYNFTAACTAL